MSQRNCKDTYALQSISVNATCINVRTQIYLGFNCSLFPKKIQNGYFFVRPICNRQFYASSIKPLYQIN